MKQNTLTKLISLLLTLSLLLGMLPVAAFAVEAGGDLTVLDYKGTKTQDIREVSAQNNGYEVNNLGATAETAASSSWGIIIIPGILGSTLKRVDTDATVWVDMSFLGATEQVLLDEDGEEIIPLYPYADNSGAQDTYEGIYKYLNNEFGEVFDVSVFAHDWRMDNTESANALQQYINNCGYTMVILVAHSMGDLLLASTFP